MTLVLCSANNKGGVCKTTLTVNLGYGLARAGRRVLVIDTDAQSNTTYSLLGKMLEENTLFDVLLNNVRMADIIVGTRQPGLYLAPASLDLSAADILMAQLVGREWRLNHAIGQLSPDDFDYILIDTPPNLGVITVNAMAACSAVVIPIALTTYALIGINILETTMATLRENLRIPLPIFGVVATLNDHTRINAEMLVNVQQHFGSRVFQTVIPRNIKIEEAHNQFISIFEHAPASTGARAYETLVQEVMQRAESR